MAGRKFSSLIERLLVCLVAEEGVEPCEREEDLPHAWRLWRLLQREFEEV